MIIGIGYFVSKSMLSRYVENNIDKILESQEVKLIKFGKFTINPLLLSLNVSELELDYENKGTQLSLYVDRVNLKLSLFKSLFSKRQYFVDLFLDDGIVRFTALGKQRELKEKVSLKKQFRDFFKKLQKGKVVVNRLNVNDLEGQWGERDLYINSLDITKSGTGYLLNGNVNHIKKSLKLRSIQVSSYLSPDEIHIKDLRMAMNNSDLRLRGKLSDLGKGGSLEFNFRGVVNTDDLLDEKNLKLHGLEAITRIEGKVRGNLNKPVVESVVFGEDFLSKYFAADELKANLVFKDKKIFISQVSLTKEKGSAYFLEEQIVYNFANKVIFPNKLKLKLNSLSLRSVLRSIPNLASYLDAQVSGGFSLGLSREGLEIDINKETSFKNFKLEAEGKEIVKLGEVLVESSVFEYLFKEKKLNLSLVTNKESSMEIDLSGQIEEGAINIKSKASKIDFKNIVHVGGLKLEGRGVQTIEAKGTIEDTELIFKGSVDNGKFAGFYFGDTTGALRLKIKDALLYFDKVEGDMGSGSYKAEGVLDLKNHNSNLEMNLKKVELGDFKKAHGPVLEGIDPVYFSLCEGHLSADYIVTGNVDINELDIKGFVFSDKMKCLGENFDRVFSRFTFNKGHFKTKSLRLQKSKAILDGKLDYKLVDENFVYSFKSKLLKLSHFDFYSLLKPGIDGGLNITLKGNVKGSSKPIHSFVMDSKLVDPIVGSEKVEGSAFKLGRVNEKYDFSLNLFKTQVKAVGQFDFEKKPGKSFLKISTRLPRWNDILSFFRSYPSSYNILDGEFLSEHEINFQGLEMKNLNYKGDVKSFKFNNNEIDWHLSKPQKISIIDGFIQNLDLNVSGGHDSFRVKGSGDVYKGASFQANGSLSAGKLSKVLHTRLRTSGDIIFNGESTLRKGVLENDYFIKSSNLNVSNKDYPVSLKDAFLDLRYQGEALTVRKIRSRLGEGFFELKGKLEYSGVFPKLYADYKMENARIDINKKSFLAITGRGGIIGDGKPYLISGDLRVVSGEIFDEFEAFKQEEDSQDLRKRYRYLPEKEGKKVRPLISLNLNVKTDRAVTIKNSLSELSLRGNIDVLGDSQQVEGVGNIYIDTRRTRKFNFNNNIFNISKLNFNFAAGQDLFNPDISFLGSSLIADYQVSISALGKIDDMQFEFSSEPFLNRVDILSLLAFGYAEDLSERLDASEREGLSSVGVGSLLFNQLKINNTLKKNLGVTVDINTKFEQDESSLLDGRSNVGGASAQVRTRTNVKLNKNISDKVNVSLSSSILDENQQKQEMNVDYKIKKNIQLQGIYEIQTNDTGINSNESQSAGADLRFQWTFD